MMESLIALSILVGLVGMAGLSMLPWEPVYMNGQLLIGVGMVSGVPTAVVYHWILYRQLVLHGVSTRGFIWNPIRFHDLIPPAARRGFLPWFYLAGLGFVVVVIGLVMMSSAMLSVLVRGV
jgi:hypothetical protein